MKYFVWLLVLLLVILHQDYWQWNDGTLLMGFLPYTLAYHVGISLAAAAVWTLAVFYCWPKGLEDVRPEYPDEDDDKPQKGPA